VPFQRAHYQLFRNALDLILTDGSLYLAKAKSCWRTGNRSKHGHDSHSSLPFPIPATFLRPASMDECVSKPHEKRRSLYLRAPLRNRRKLFR